MGNSKIQLASGETLFDLTADTITAAGLLNTMTAHGADGEPIAGQLIDGYSQYASAALTFGTGENYTVLNGWILDLGFVPRLFVMYATSSGSGNELEAYYRVEMGFFCKGFKNAEGTDIDMIRGLHAVDWASYPARIYSYSDIGIFPYESGNIKGVKGDSTASSYVYRLMGAYRYFAFA